MRGAHLSPTWSPTDPGRRPGGAARSSSPGSSGRPAAVSDDLFVAPPTATPPVGGGAPAPLGPPPLAGHTVIYGGSFDPPHLGHRAACAHLLSRGAAAVWVTPVFRHADGKNLADFDHRRAMCERMVADLGPGVTIDDAEARLGGRGQTSELLAFLRAREPGRPLVLALGDDLRLSAPTWEGWQAMAATTPVEWLPRGGQPLGQPSLATLPTVSSTEVRRRLARGDSARDLLVPEVAAYIDAHRLYQAPDGGQQGDASAPGGRTRRTGDVPEGPS